MDRYPGYESMLTRVEHMKSQVKGQLAPEQSHLVDDLVAFMLYQFDECRNVPFVDASTNTNEDHRLSDGSVAREDDTRIDVNEQTNLVNPQVDHQREGSISSGQTVSSVAPPPTVSHSTIQANIKVEGGQSVQLCEYIKKEEEDGGEYVMECDCEDCETCRVKREMKEELDESGETELGGNRAQVVQGCIRVKKEEEDSEVEGERQNKIQRMDRVMKNVPVGSPSFNAISTNVECIDDQMSTSSITPTTIEDHSQPSQPVTIPLLTGEPKMDNVGLDVGADEFDREQIDDDNSTLNSVHIDQDDQEDDEDETIEQREDSSDDDYERQVQVSAENFVKRIEPADELGNRFECDYQQCGRRMKHRSDMIRHIRSHTGEKIFMCSVAGCDRAFARMGHLDEHTRTHTGERPFECGQCNATFTHHGNLVTHLRTHTGARPFVCTWPECGQAFTRSSILKTHSIVYSNECQFVCDVTGCAKVYKRKDTLRKHQKDKHN